MLYPLKFEPIYKERIWGGKKLRNDYYRFCPEDIPVGESWKLSGIDGDLSVVTNGDLAGNNIQELIEIYMGDLVGEKVFDRFGLEFPVLVKLLDASDILSVQVHPDDELASERHGAYGKTEMWYVMEADEDSFIYLGFNKNLSREEYLRHHDDKTIQSVLKKYKVAKGDMFYLPAGTIHAIGSGILLTEIQQTSDITYRVYDWDRTDKKGKKRDLHTELAVDAINFDSREELYIKKSSEKNKSVEVVATEFFTVNLIEIDGEMERDYADLDSFVIYQCLEGELFIDTEGGMEYMMDAETVLLPAVFSSASIKGRGKFLEVYIKEE
ncbi:MAG: class I mannose-6-phosphate isomerase [Rikenellaceae bacterium]|nr:class I mannose-6-phosphate isomerase [Rikenellaceae bacterium]